MSKFISGTLTVPFFNPTGNPGEYSLENVAYLSQTDADGSGTTAIAPGMVVYVPASDPSSFFPLPGVVHRYKITSSAVVDQATVNLVVTWDEVGEEQDAPTNGAVCIMTEVTEKKGLGYVIAEAFYPDIAPGTTVGATNCDIQNITDVMGNTQTVLFVQKDVATTWTITHGKGSTDFVYTIFDENANQCLPNNIEVISNNAVAIHFLVAMKGKVIFNFV